jgi:hypothetical protein
MRNTKSELMKTDTQISGLNKSMGASDMASLFYKKAPQEETKQVINKLTI